MTQELSEAVVKAFPARQIAITELPKWAQNVLNDYIVIVEHKQVVQDVKDADIGLANRTLQFFISQKAQDLFDISYLMVQEASISFRSQNVSPIRNFVRFIGELTARPYLHYMASRKNSKRLVWDRDGEFKRLSEGGIVIEQFVQLVHQLYEYRKNHGFSRSASNTVLTLKSDFCLFLAANNLRFTLAVAKRWCQIIEKPPINMYSKLLHCYLCWIDALATGHKADERLIFPYYKAPTKQPPVWAKSEVDKYLSILRQDHLTESTTRMYLVCLVRFLWYMDNKGIKSLYELTAELVKRYNIDDNNHKTVAAKNAYNVRIRRFLSWLFTGGIIKRDLGNALPTNSAPTIRPVQILTKEQQERIDAYCQQKSNTSRVFYRDVAMVKLMRYMGLRACDVVALKFSSINLKTQELCINQQKTAKDLRLPIPTHVLNSIINYIEKERPTPLVKTDFVFLSYRAPYNNLEPIAAQTALTNILKNGQSHMLRRTFATELMTGQTDLSLIAHSLGHSNNLTIHKYLNTDQVRMQECSLSISEMKYHGELL